jgi:predicted amidohydrolase
VLFPESALGGYPGVDFASFRGYDWRALAAAEEEVARAARAHRIWIVCGTHHRSGSRGRPLNSLLVIDPTGAVVARYDKRLLTGPAGEGELAHFRPGAKPVVVEIEGVRCGLLICHEWRYPEVYRQYVALGAKVILQSWHDGAYDDRAWRREGRALQDVIPATVQGHAVCNHLWICGSNTSRRYSCFGGFFLRPDGTFLARQPRHRRGVLVRTLDIDASPPDPAAHLRPRVMRGLLDSRS